MAALRGCSSFVPVTYPASVIPQSEMLNRIKGMIEEHLANPIDEEVFRCAIGQFVREQGSQAAFEELVSQAIRSRSVCIVRILCECFSERGFCLNQQQDDFRQFSSLKGTLRQLTCEIAEHKATASDEVVMRNKAILEILVHHRLCLEDEFHTICIAEDDKISSAFLESAIKEDWIDVKLRMIELFIELGVDVNPQGFYKPLDEVCCYYPHIDVIRILVAHGAEVKDSYLTNAARSCSVEAFQFLEQILQEQESLTEDVLKCSLSEACASGNHAIAEFLIKRGMSVRVEDECGYHYIHLAYDEKTAELLLEHGEDIDVLNQEGETTLVAVLKRNIDGPGSEVRISKLARYLIGRGADVTSKCSEGNPLICLASRKDDAELMRAVISKYKDSSWVDIRGSCRQLGTSDFYGNPLDIAGKYCNPQTFVELVRSGANPNKTGESGLTAFEVAMEVRTQGLEYWTPRQLAVVELLFGQGLLKISDRDQEGRTYLQQASKVGNLAVVERLVQLKGRLDVVDNNGDTPLHLALSHTNIENSGIRFQEATRQGCTLVAEYIARNHLKSAKERRVD